MDKIEDGGPAFPMQDPKAINAFASAKVAQMPEGSSTDERDAAYIQARAEAIGGMSLRDYFAAKAMQGMLANKHQYQIGDEHMFFRDAYTLADGMLRARGQS